jgi:alpha-tubulin suppressor-like RCC1 family protein
MARRTGKARCGIGGDAGSADALDVTPRPVMRRRRSLLTLTVGVLLAALLSAVFSGAAWADEKAPKVTKDPSSVIVEAGQSASFEATASGPPPPTVQWQISTDEGAVWNRIEGATSDQFEIPETSTSESGDRFRAVFKNPKGQAVSEVATLTVRIPPSVTENPQSTTVQEGQSASFEAAGSGFPTPTVQWELSTNGGGTWSKIAKATSDKFTIASAKTSETGNEYRATFENAAGHVMSTAATLNVQLAPRVSTQPTSTSVEVGDSATFEAVAVGSPTPTVQWEESTNEGASWSPVEGAISDQLTISDAQRSETGDEYRAAFENAAGKATSNAATLTVQDPPKVTEQPTSTTVEVEQSATFEAAASGIPTPTVQWELSTNHGGSWTPLEGATSDQVTVASAATSESGDEYRAVFTSSAGTATSEPATLTVTTHHYAVVDWGGNTFGALGDGNLNNSDVPVAPSGLKFVTSVSGGAYFSLALLSDGTVMAWGEDEFGQLGAAPGEQATLSDVPVPVEGLSNVVQISAGRNFGMALLSNGTVEAWGGGEFGQLGDGNLEESLTPVPVKGLTGVTAIAAGGEDGLALLSNGTIKAWGANASGELGNGSFENSDVPVSVIKVSGVASIEASGEDSLALLKDGSVMAWGEDEYGQLGNPEVEEETDGERESNEAVPVEGLSGVTALAAGQRFSMALLSSGSVDAWGENRSGQLGDGTTAREDEKPAAVKGITDVAQIAAGGSHSIALLGDGVAMTWGEDKFGQLGNGTVGASSVEPVQVSGLGEQVGISAGSIHDLAYGEPLPEVTVVTPDGAPLSGGTSVTITGVDLSEASAVSFGGVAATSFTVEPSGSISAVAPAHAAGTVDVTVTTPSGTSPATPGDRFTYAPAPTVKKISPKSGPSQGGTTVTITGQGFSQASAVHFGASAAASYKIISATSITAVTPAGTAGTVPVTVTSPFGTSAASEAKFKYKKK